MSTFTRFKAWLEATSPKTLLTFAGAAPAKRAARLKRALKGVKTASALLELHRTLGGQLTRDAQGQLIVKKGVHFFDAFLTIDEVFEVKDMLDGRAQGGEWNEPGIEWTSWWVVGWVPVLENFSNDSICIDTTGSFGGVVGQVHRAWRAAPHQASDGGEVLSRPLAWVPEELHGPKEARCFEIDAQAALTSRAPSSTTPTAGAPAPRRGSPAPRARDERQPGG